MKLLINIVILLNMLVSVYFMLQGNTPTAIYYLLWAALFQTFLLEINQNRQ